MPIELPDLPYPRTALEPHISAATLDAHHGQHHRALVDAVNRRLPGSGLEDQPLEQIVRMARGRLFEDAAEAWSHAFYWHCLAPQGGGEPIGRMAQMIGSQFGDFSRFKEEFERQALALFGSGWLWLVQRADGSLGLVSIRGTGAPLTGSDTALLACDLWEHAYYLDRQNQRAEYLKAYWKLVDWNAANKRLR